MEFRHLWKSRWTIILIVMLIFNGILFGSSGIINQYDKKEYIDDYSMYIEATLNSADTMSGISIFAKQNSYSSKNIERTKNVFAKCRNIELEETNDTALEQIMSRNVNVKKGAPKLWEYALENFIQPNVGKAIKE